MTMTNAEWMINNKIDFFRLACKRNTDDAERLYTFDIMLDDRKISKVYANNTSEIDVILAWLDMKHKEPILDDAEKRYLKAVIRPFRDKVLGITKFLDTNTGEEYIAIDIGEEIGVLLPDFEANTMYEGMVLRKEYTLEELGL